MTDKILFQITVDDANIIANDMAGRDLVQEELDELEIILNDQLRWGNIIEEFIKGLRF